MLARTSGDAATQPLALIADRDPDTRALYRHALTASGWQVDEADDGRDALAKALSHPPRLLLTETRLSFINGFQLCELLRSDAATRDVAIVIVTGDAQQAQIVRARAAGADTVLVKPCLPERIVREVDRLMLRSQELRERSRELISDLQAATQNSHERMSEAADAAGGPTGTGSDPTLPRRKMSVRAHQRYDTTTPPTLPPPLRCPSCDRPLTYERSHIGGVNAQFPEQWDYYVCAGGCGGTYQYRQRTRKLRSIN
jgi:two-component system, cell cycle response regulator DivK